MDQSVYKSDIGVYEKYNWFLIKWEHIRIGNLLKASVCFLE